MTAELLMICPTRGRPNNIISLWIAWTATRTTRADLLLVADQDDPQLDTYRRVLDQLNQPAGPRMLIMPERLRMIGALNAAVTAMIPANDYRFVGFLGDDHRPRTRGWDSRFVECLSGGTGIVYGNDLLQREKMPTAVAVTSDIVTTLGYFAPPELEHLCADLVWLEWGKAIGRITYLDDVVLEHMHPANGKAAHDRGYEEANNSAQVTRDAEAYHAYMSGRFSEDVAKLKALLY